MPPFGPIKRDEFIRRLRQLGFTGPHPGKRHQVMRRGAQKVPIPNLHGGDIGGILVARILREIGVSREEWEQL